MIWAADTRLQQMSGTSQYVHGSSDIEQRRLTALNEWINERMLPEMRLTGGERIIDFGCGLAQFSRMLAREAGTRHPVVCIERDPRQIAEAMRQAREVHEEHLLDMRRGDCLIDPPITPAEWGQFDLAHARFILEHVPDPLGVVRHMLRAVRRGGRIILADDDHEILRCWPDIPDFMRIWHAYQETYRQCGNDPIIGRRLVELLHSAGAKPRRNTWVFFGSCVGEDIWPVVVQNLVVILHGAREAVLGASGMSTAVFDQGIQQLREWSTQPDAALWYAIALAEGIKP